MLTLKNWDINLRASEKKTLLSFLLLYAFLTLLVLFSIAILYYGFQRDLMLQDKRELLSSLTNEHVSKLKSLQEKSPKKAIYPADERFKFAIFNSKLKVIFSNLQSNDVNLYKDIYLKNGYIHFTKEFDSFYLGGRYIVVEIEAPKEWHTKVYKELSLYGGFIFLILVVIGYFLLNLLLQPMRNAISLLDRFIKDTTHELNTPINAILSNIEMIEAEAIDERLSKKIKRIKIASKTISNLYEDLTYLTLSHQILSQDEIVNLKQLIEERIEYFSLLLESKKITLTSTLEDDITLTIDRKKITKLLDNILSNAIKYNKMEGTIHINLSSNTIEVIDSGKGIEPEKITRIFERYTRLDTTVGGFGIGLSIVSFIAKEYGLHVKIESELSKGTTVSITW